MNPPLTVLQIPDLFGAFFKHRMENHIESADVHLTVHYATSFLLLFALQDQTPHNFNSRIDVLCCGWLGSTSLSIAQLHSKSSFALLHTTTTCSAYQCLLGPAEHIIVLCFTSPIAAVRYYNPLCVSMFFALLYVASLLCTPLKSAQQNPLL
jgi:hypothetical protein